MKQTRFKVCVTHMFCNLCHQLHLYYVDDLKGLLCAIGANAISGMAVKFNTTQYESTQFGCFILT